jgi:HK97 family phage prohead protease
VNLKRDMKRDIRFFTNALKAFTVEKDDGRKDHYLEGVASSTVVDRMGDRIAESAQQQMLQDARGITMFLNHEYSVPDDVFGTCEESFLRPGVDAEQGECFDLVIRVRIEQESERAMKCWRMVQNGTKLGFSIGGQVESWETQPNPKKGGSDIFTITGIRLYEISCVGIPANQRALVDVVSKALRSKRQEEKVDISYEFGGETSVDEARLALKEADACEKAAEVAKAVELNEKGRAHAASLIAAGKVDKDSSWSFDAEDSDKLLGNDDWEAYSKWFLGREPGEDAETKAAWKYPYGKDGKVYRSALVAIRQRAGQQSAKAVFDAAGALLEKVDGKKDGEKEANSPEFRAVVEPRPVEDEAEIAKSHEDEVQRFVSLGADTATALKCVALRDEAAEIAALEDEDLLIAVKEGRTVSADTAAMLTTCMDSLRKALDHNAVAREHKITAMKILQGLIPSGFEGDPADPTPTVVDPGNPYNSTDPLPDFGQYGKQFEAQAGDSQAALEKSRAELEQLTAQIAAAKEQLAAIKAEAEAAKQTRKGRKTVVVLSTGSQTSEPASDVTDPKSRYETDADIMRELYERMSGTATPSGVDGRSLSDEIEE